MFACPSLQGRHRDIHEVLQNERNARDVAREQPGTRNDYYQSYSIIDTYRPAAEGTTACFTISCTKKRRPVVQLRMGSIKVKKLPNHLNVAIVFADHMQQH